MSFNPNQKRDDDGKWTGQVGSHAQSAVEWIKSPQAKAIVAKLSSPDTIKAAATFAVQGALFKLGGINDPNIDAAIKHQVSTFAADAKVTTAHARQVMLSVVRSLIKSREGKE